MARASLKRLSPLIAEGDGAFQQTVDQTADAVQRRLHGVVKRAGHPGRTLKDLLHGTWLGHPLHSALSDVPIGAWWTGALLDLFGLRRAAEDRKSTRLNSSHLVISYAVFCLKKKHRRLPA